MIRTTDPLVAAEALKAGGLIALPTETVYGLGADAANGEAVQRIFAAKGRPANHPLIVHVATVEAAYRWCALSPRQRLLFDLLAHAFWPGPLTLIVPRSAKAAPETVGQADTIGIRVPAHPMARAILDAFDGGVAAPSANRFGKVSPTTADHVIDDLGEAVDVVVDGGPSNVGVESTIVSLVGDRPRLLRPGGVSRAQIESVLDEPLDEATNTTKVRAPGMLPSHYAPEAAVVVVTADELRARLAAGEGGDSVGVLAPFVVNHQPSWVTASDAESFAAHLYENLRRADRAEVEVLLIVPPVHGVLLEAVVDRLTKAAAAAG